MILNNNKNYKILIIIYVIYFNEQYINTYVII